ncbi:hypothetical protein Anapl_00603 [Anas platyrhynchos]|uniref:Uncharacterized protein n=1 Tax=Anas platyrhynchos TaxID=8839 RepID=R0LZV7_ANAPL|nr:hypothetical protein Anapl_00603 [Anas platyrhynchos]
MALLAPQGLLPLELMSRDQTARVIYCLCFAFHLRNYSQSKAVATKDMRIATWRPHAPVPGHPLLQLLTMNSTQPPAARPLWHPELSPAFTEHKPCVPAGKSKSGHIGIHKTKGSKGSTPSKSLRNTMQAEIGFSSTPVTAARALPGSRERPPK